VSVHRFSTVVHTFSTALSTKVDDRGVFFLDDRRRCAEPSSRMRVSGVGNLR
jgi:hypothetical protein